MKAVFLEQNTISNAFYQIKKFERLNYTKMLLEEVSSGRCLSSQEANYLLEISNGNITGFIRATLNAVSASNQKLTNGGKMTGLRNE